MNRREFLKLFGLGISGLLIIPKAFAESDVLPLWNPPAGFNRGSLDAVNHRRIVLEIKKAMEEVLIYHRYELNDSTTHSSIQAMMNSRLEILHNARLIDDYAAICNNANNPPIRIDQGYVNLDVSVNLNKNSKRIDMVVSMFKEVISFAEFI